MSAPGKSVLDETKFSASDSFQAVPFFLPGSQGDLFAMYYPPHCTPGRGGLLYIHPISEEAEVSRPMIAAVAREIARAGYGVLALDLYGCGDSAGEFRDARLDVWREDLALGAQWLRDRNLPVVGLWGLQLGGLLALDLATQTLSNQARSAFPFLVLWNQPSSGAEVLRYVLRRSLVKEDNGPTTSQDLRTSLLSGVSVEIAGWELHPDLAFALEELESTSLLSQLSDCRIYCAEFGQAVRSSFRAIQSQTMQACRDANVTIDFQRLPVRPFWTRTVRTRQDCQVLSEYMKGILAKWPHQF